MPAGRPTEYRADYANQAYKLCLLNADDDDLADFFGVSQRTINTWKKKQPEFLQSLKDGKDKADAEVAERLHSRATGYEWDEKQPIKVKEVLYKDGKRLKETERIELVDVHRVIPPDPTSMIFWLKNRKKDRWRDKSELENSGEQKIIVETRKYASSNHQDD